MAILRVYERPDGHERGDQFLFQVTIVPKGTTAQLKGLKDPLRIPRAPIRAALAAHGFVWAWAEHFDKNGRRSEWIWPVFPHHFSIQGEFPMSHRSAIAHIDKLAKSIPESSEILAPLSAAIAADETLMAGTPTVDECAASSAGLCDALSGVLKAFGASGVTLPNPEDGHELVRSVGRVLAS